MKKIHWFVEQEEGWEDGCFRKTLTCKPIEPQEAEFLQQAIAVKELARAQQKLLKTSLNHTKVIGTSGPGHPPFRYK